MMHHRTRSRMLIMMLMLPFVAAALFSMPKQAQGVTRTWDGEGSTNDWSECANWSANTCPGASDVAAFDNTSDKDAAIDASFAGSVQGINIGSGYDGTITQARSITIGSAGFVQAGGTFAGGADNIELNGSSFSLSGGAFTSTSATLIVEANFTVTNTPDFEANGGTVHFDGSNTSSTINCNGIDFNLVTWNKTNAGNVTISAGCDVPLGDSPTTNSSPVHINGTLTINSGTWTHNASGLNGVGHVNLNSGGAIVSGGTAIDINGGGDLTLDAGGTFPQTITTLSVQGDLVNSGNLLPDGITLTLDGSNSSSSVTCGDAVWTLVVIAKTNAGGVTVGSDCDFPIGDSPTTVASGLVINGTVTAGTGTWTHTAGGLNGTGNLTLNNGGTIAMGGTTLNIDDEGSLTLNAGGTFPQTITALNVQGNLNNSASLLPDGITLTLDGSNSSSNVTCGDAEWALVVISKGNAGGVTVGSDCDFPIGDNPTTVASGLFIDGTVTAGTGTWIHTAAGLNGTGNMTLRTGGTIAMSGNALNVNDAGSLTLESGSTFSSNINTINVEGGFVNGNVVADSVNLTMDGAGSGSFACGDASYSMIVINKSGGSLTPTSDCTTVDFTRTNGAVNNPSSNFTYHVTGNLSFSSGSSFGGPNLAVEMEGSADKTIAHNAGTILSQIRVNKDPGIKVSTTTSTSVYSLLVQSGIFEQGAANNLTLADGMTIGQAGTFTNTSTGDLTLGGPVSNEGTLTIDGTSIGCGDTNSIVISSSSGAGIVWTGTGAFTVYDADVSDMVGDVRAYSSTDSGDNGWAVVSYCPPDFTQGDYRWYQNADSSAPGSALAGENGPVDFDPSAPVRLRLNAQAAGPTLAAGNQRLNLQFSDSLAGPWAAVGREWWDTDWSARRRIGFNNLDSATNLADFPLLVSLDSTTIDYSKTQDAGQDIRFVDGDGTPLAYEIENWDESGTSNVWVKVPQIDAATDTDFVYLYYGNVGASDAQAPTSVWDGGFKGVWHMQQDPSGSAPQIADSTSNAQHGTSNGSMASNDSVGARIHKGVDFDGTNDYIDVGNGNLNITGMALTVSMWTKNNVSTAQFDALFSKSTSTSWNNGYGMFYNSSSQVRFWVTTYTANVASATISPTAWNHIVGVYDGTTVQIYVNGVAGTPDSYTGNISTAAANATISRGASDSYNVNGIIDEVRVSNVARSADWTLFEYRNQSNQTNSFGQEEVLDSTVTYQDNPSVANGAAISALLSSSDKAQTYQESAPSALNANEVLDGEYSEWDFSLDPTNIPVTGASYYFRLAYPDNTPLFAYGNYPTLKGSMFSQSDYRWHANADSADPGSALAGENAAANIGSVSSPVRLRINAEVSNQDLSASVQSFKLQYANSVAGPWTDLPNAWWNADWQSRRKIVFDNSSANSDLVDFPLPVVLGPDSIDYSKTKDAGEDIRFTDSDGTPLDYEIEKWDESGASSVWVRVPQIDGASTSDHIWMYYNNAAASDAQNAAGVWNSGYTSVWHMNSQSGVSLTESTSNGKHGTKLSESEPANFAAGKIGGAQDFDGTNDYVQVTAPALPTGNFTYSAWVNIDASGTILMSAGNTTNEFILTTDPVDVFTNNSSRLTTAKMMGTGNWTYVTATRSGGSIRAYLNAVLDSSSGTDAAALDFSSCQFLIGTDSDSGCAGSLGDYFNGRMDELRVSNVARSADWIKAEYKSMAGGFSRVGNEEDLSSITGHPWSFYGNASPADGAAITPALADSDVAGSYEEGNGSALNPNAAAAGQKIEWDWAIIPSKVLKGKYFFRMAKADGMELDSYVRYPEITWAVPASASAATGGASGGGTPASGGGNSSSGSGTGGASGGGSVAENSSWWNVSWANRIKITIDNSDSAVNLTDFPLLVSLSSSNIDYAKVQNSGQDLRFMDGTTLLSHQIEKWDEAGTSEVWVRVPQIDAGSTTDYIWLYYNNPDALDIQAPTSVWDSDFKGVYHLADGSTLSGADATANANNATLNSTPVAAAGQVGGGATFDSANDNLAISDVSVNGASYTISAWFNYPLASTSAWNTLTRGSAADHHVIVQRSTLQLGAFDNGAGQFRSTGFVMSTLSNGWHHLTAVGSGTTTTYYIDGVLVGSVPFKSSSQISYLGNCQCNSQQWGTADEIRISTVARSEDWIEAEYLSVSGQMNSFGSEQARPSSSGGGGASP